MARTKRQQEILDVVQAHMEQKGYPPTVREIGEAVGLNSPSTVHAHLKALEESGALTRDATKPRAIDLADRRTARDARRVEIDDLPGVRMLPEQITGSGDNFLLKVRGDSMINAGILDGDTVVIRRQDDCADGEIAACLIDGDEATVKRLRRIEGRVRLDPENDQLEPFFPDHVVVMGIVVGVFRRI